MDRERKGIVDPAAHQPSKAELEKDVSIDAAPEALGWAITRGGAERRKSESNQQPPLRTQWKY